MLKQMISRVARFAAREFADELAKAQQAGSVANTASSGVPSEMVKVDVADVLAQLNSNIAKQRLNHFFAWNHRWVALLSERNRRAAVSTYDFVDAEMDSALFVVDQFKVVESRAEDIGNTEGQILDLGVYKGGSTRALARVFPDKHIHGFDSFEGLPENWSHALKGDFGEIQGVLPDMPENVTLYKGWFEDTLPGWREANKHLPIALLRVDCDIYSSTRTIFEELESLIRPGTWILFDELIGYRGWEQHEHRAFSEFIERTGYEYEYLAYGLTYTLARLKV